jgi:hypothetical protein
MPWKCPVCGAENEDDKEFCVVCGAVRPSNDEAEKQEALQLQEPRAKYVEKAEEEAVTEEAAIAEASGAPEEATVVEEETVGEAVEEAEAEQPPPTAPIEVLYFEVVNAPAPDLVGKKIPLMFKVFPQITIGRSPENVVILPDPTVSRRHATIRVEDGKVVLVDLGSTNGTYVYNSETGSFDKVEKVELKPGMIVRFGENTIVKIVSEP